MADELKQAAEKADAAEVKIDALTGIKGSSGNWFSSHPGVIVAGVVVVLAAMAFLHSCVGMI